MLYNLHDARQRALAPVRQMAEATRAAFASPLNPWSFTPFGRAMAAGSDVVENMLRKREKPAWQLDHVKDGSRTLPLRVETVVQRPFCNLIRFHRPDPARNGDPKLLLLAPLSGHHATLLRETVRALAVDHDVYVTDWVDAAQVPLSQGPFGLDDYIGYLLDFIAALGPGTHVMAVCQPAPPALAAAAIMSARQDPNLPASLILMGGPVDPAAAPTAVTRLACEHTLDWFRSHCTYSVPANLPGAGRKVYPGFLQLRAFLSMNPARHATAHWSMFQHLVRGDGDSAEAHRKFYDEYLSVMDVPAEFYLETIETVFQKRSLATGGMRWRGQAVRPELITRIPLMTVEGELDDISAPGQTEAAHMLCSGLAADMHLNHVQKGAGHYGIFSGRRWREEVKPAIAAFIRAHDRKDAA